jgi:hypothetical protein
MFAEATAAAKKSAAISVSSENLIWIFRDAGSKEKLETALRGPTRQKWQVGDLNSGCQR